MEKYTLFYLIALVLFITMIVHVLLGGMFWAIVLCFAVMIFVNMGSTEFYEQKYNKFLDNSRDQQ